MMGGVSSPAPLVTQTPERSLSWQQSLLVGSLIFGLFFGAGNLIFPVAMGLQAGSATPAATLGFLVMAVGLPVIGVIAFAVSRADGLPELASRVGRPFALAFTCALYLTIGPFFAIPRTATVSFEMAGGGLDPVLKPVALAAFSLAFFAIATAAALRPGRLLDYVGRYLTPLFLVLLGVVVVASLAMPLTGTLPGASGDYVASPATQGLLDGYNTMDALASLAFAVLIVEAVRRLGVRDPRRMAWEVAKGGIFAVIAMSVIYAALAYLGATASGLVARDTNGARTLAAVCGHYFGPAGLVLAAAIMLVACLKTAIGLLLACGATFHELAPRLPQRAWVLVFAGMSCALANVGLTQILAAAIPVLRFLYPLAIVLIGLALASHWTSSRPMLWRCVVALTAIGSLLDVAQLFRGVPVVDAVVAAAGILPGYAVGFGWVVPSLVGLALALVLSRKERRRSQR